MEEKVHKNEAILNYVNSPSQPTIYKNVAFCGQMHYFAATIPKNMSGWNIHKVNVNFEPSDPTRYFPLLELQRKHKIDVWIFFRGEFAPRQVLNQLEGKKVWISTEPLARKDVNDLFFGLNSSFIEQHLPLFDAFYHYDKTEIERLKSHGYHVTGAFPLPVDLDTYAPCSEVQKIYDGVFLGRSNERRASLLGGIKKDFDFLHVDHGMIGEEAVRVYQQSKIGLSLSIANWKQFPHRIQNMMACGLPILCDETTYTDWVPKKYTKCIWMSIHIGSGTLYSQFKELLSDEDRLKTMSEMSRALVEKHFDAKKNWKTLLEEI